MKPSVEGLTHSFDALMYMKDYKPSHDVHADVGKIASSIHAIVSDDGEYIEPCPLFHTPPSS
jgi:hypothetical protein